MADTTFGLEPTILGTINGQTTFGASLHPFLHVTLSDPNAGATDTLTIALAGATGTLADSAGFGGLIANADGTYTLQGSAAAITSELNALVFTPTAAAPGAQAITTFTLSDSSSGYGTMHFGSSPTVLTNFSGTSIRNPGGGLVADAAGNLYGTTHDGGTYGLGTVFELVKSGSGYSAPVTLASFDATSGGYLQCSLLLDAAGNLFGTAHYGGAFSYGTVFEVAKTGTGYSAPIVLASFNYSNGSEPYSNLIADAAGNLFGTTDGGGAFGYGTVFELVKTGSTYSAPVTLASFNNANGGHPYAGLIADAAGNLFGTTVFGGASGVGTVFELAKTGSGYSAPVTLASFNTSNGSNPVGGLIADAAGNLFGTTRYGGAGGYGIVYELVNTGSGYSAPVTLASFNSSNGANPYSTLITDSAGNLFGTTTSGGAYGYGTAFELVKTGSGYSAPVTLASFDGTDGGGPGAALIIDSAGNLISTVPGETPTGAQLGSGFVFEITTSKTLATVTDATTTVINTTPSGSPTKVGGEFLVNTQTAGDQYFPIITSLANGGFVVTWQDYSGTLGDNSGTSIKAQLFDSTGTKHGSEFLVNTQTGIDQLNPRITGLANGGFVITWYDANGTLSDGSGGSIKAQVFDANGAKQGSEFLVFSEPGTWRELPQITGLANGGFVVTWNDSSSILGDSSVWGIFAQAFNASGVKQGSEFLVNTQTSNAQFYPSITGLEGGGFVVTWIDSSGTLGDGSGNSIKAQMFGASGAKQGAEFLVNTQTAGNQLTPTIAGLANGGFVVTWYDASGTLGDSSGKSIKGQVFDASGAKQGGEFLVNTQTASDQLSPTITSLANGGFVVTWQDFSGTLGDSQGSSIKAQVFDASGTKQGGEFLVNTQMGGDQRNPTIAGLGNGGFAITWQDFSGTQGDGSGGSIKAQIYSLPAVYNTITGTSAKDTLTGTASNDHILGLAGNDTLTGLAGNDLLDGGAGKDKLVGGLGDDIYVVDDKGDSVVEKAGEGTDTVQTTLRKYTLGKALENLTFTDSAGHSGTGNAVANHIIGGSGNDVLNGKAGADVLEGGLGDDIYYIDNTEDTVIELANAGTDTAFATVSFTLSDNVENLTLKSGKTALTETGNASDNVLTGNSNANVISGLGGNDTLYGGSGNDTLTGGAGADRFVFDTKLNAKSNLDTVTDFVSGTDTLVLDQTVFKAFAATGAIGAGAFWSGAGVNAAHDADDRIIYNTTTGALWYDADGNGTGKAVEVAVLASHPTLAFTDFHIVV